MADKFTILAPKINVTPDEQNSSTKFSIINPVAKNAIDPNAPIDFSSRKMVENLLPSLKQEAIDIGSALMSPMETGESLINVIVGGVQKLDPTGLTGDDKVKYANAIGEYYANKYGSLNAFKRELQNNPASVLGDASMFITGGATSVAKTASLANKLANSNTLKKISDVASDTAKVGASIDPFNLALNTTLTTAGQGARALGIGANTAENLYEKALSPSSSLTQAERKAIIKTALDKKLGIDSAGVDKLQSRVAELNERVEKLIETATNSDVGIPSNVIFKNLESLKNDVGGFKIEAANDLKEIARIESKFKKWAKKIGKDKTITAKDLQDFKIDISSKVDWKSKNLKGTPTEEKLFKNLRKSAKEGIAESIPEIAPLNKELSELYSLEPYLIRGADRIKNSDTMGIIPSLSSAGNRAIAKLGIGVNEYRNKPISALLDNKPTRPLITNILGTVGDVNYDNDNLLPFRELVKLYE